MYVLYIYIYIVYVLLYTYMYTRGARMAKGREAPATRGAGESASMDPELEIGGKRPTPRR